jgi:hypothetical protein
MEEKQNKKKSINKKKILNRKRSRERNVQILKKKKKKLEKLKEIKLIFPENVPIPQNLNQIF